MRNFSEIFAAELVETTSDAVVIVDPANRVVFANPSALDTFQYKEEELIGQSLNILLPYQVRGEHAGYIEKFAKADRPKKLMSDRPEVNGLRKDGAIIKVKAAICTVVVDGKTYFAAIVRDVTEESRAREEMRAENLILDGVSEIQRLFIEAGDAQATYDRLVDLLLQVTGGDMGVACEFTTDRSGATVMSVVSQRKRKGLNTKTLDVFETSQQRVDTVHLSKMIQALESDDGSVFFPPTGNGMRWLEMVFPEGGLKMFSGIALREGGELTGFVGVADFNLTKLDHLRSYREAFLSALGTISTTINRERSKNLAERSLQNAQRIAKLGNWEWDREKDKLWCSDELYSIYEREPKEFTQSWDSFFDCYHPDDRARVRAAYVKGVKGTHPIQIEHRLIVPSGVTKTISQVAETEFNELGELVRVTGTIQDITERKEILHQLNQAQKMEAVGQLTGGIAHDFNNYLTAVLGNLTLASGADKLDEAKAAAARAREAGIKSRDLVKQLLSFSRGGKDVAESVEVDSLVAGLVELLRRTIGENVHLVLNSHAAGAMSHIAPSQLESSILNLCINARDAMPNGGKIELSTMVIPRSEVPEPELVDDCDEFVLIEIADTGTGMSEDIAAKIFEPFFSTKGHGEGSGLGLAMVYGFVRQSKGSIQVKSKTDAGTTFEIYLPLNGTALLEAAPTSPNESAEFSACGKRALVVEDNDLVRDLTVAYLKRLGFEIVEAPDAKTALVCHDNHLKFDLLLTDIMLEGGMNGVDLAAKIRERQNDLVVVYVSGFTEEEVREKMVLSADQFLNKPFELETLRHKLDQAFACA